MSSDIHGRRIINAVGMILVWVSVVSVVAGFFLPWVTIDVRAAGAMERLDALTNSSAAGDKVLQGASRISLQIHQGTKTISADIPALADLPRQLRGIDIPRVAHDERLQVALAVAQLLTGHSQDVARKSNAVYLVPAFAIISGVLLTGCRGSRVTGTVIALLAATIAGIGAWKFSTLTTPTPIVHVTIASGLWLSLAAYLGLTVGAMLRTASLIDKVSHRPL